jgi:anaphase-promoting complex subunit 6
VIGDDPNDAFWLAQTFFMTHQYSRAERLLTRPFSINVPINDTSDLPLPNGHGHPLTNLSSFANTTANAKGKGKEVPLPMSVPRLPMGPGGMIEIPEDMEEGVSRLVDMSVACRYLAAQCQVCNIASNHILYIIYPSFRCDKGIGQKQLKCSGRRIRFVILVS